LEKVLKPVVKPLRPIVSKAIPILPFTAPAAMFVKAKAFGIKSERGTAGYKKSQKVVRIGAAATGVAVGGYLAAPAIGGAVSSAGSAIWSGLSAVGGKVALGATSLVRGLTGGGKVGVEDMAGFAALATPLLGSNDNRATGAGGADSYGDGYAPDPGRSVAEQERAAGVAPWVWVVGAAGLVIGGMFLFRGKGTA
jgi:hypothetical protein